MGYGNKYHFYRFAVEAEFYSDVGRVVDVLTKISNIRYIEVSAWMCDQWFISVRRPVHVTCSSIASPPSSSSSLLLPNTINLILTFIERF